MGGLPKFGSDGGKGSESPPPSATAPKREPETNPNENASAQSGWPFGEIDFDAIGLAAETSTRRKSLENAAAPNSSSARTNEDRTQIAGLGVLAEAIAKTRLSSPPSSSSSSPSSASRPPLSARTQRASSASEVLPRLDLDPDPVGTMRELYAQGDAEAALAIASELVGSDEDPFVNLQILVDEEDSEDSTAIAASPISGRLAAFTSQKIPRLLIARNEISRLPIDPRAAFIVGHIDGIQSMGDILDICAMPESEALEVFALLQSLGVISLS